MNEKTFEPGQQWRMRGGKIATISRMMGSGNVSAYWSDMMSVFAPTGRYWFHDEESEFDLMEPV